MPEADVTIEGLAVTDTQLWLLDMDGGLSSLRLFDLEGTPAGPVEVPPNCAVGGLSRLDGHEVAYATESFTEPRSWWRASGESAPRRTALVTETRLDFSGFEVRQEFATSADGTQVPPTLIAPQGTLTAGEFDPRVDAYHANKMAARLQAATSSSQPVLLRVEPGGHGLGSSLDQRVSELADVSAFLFDRLGINYHVAADRTKG